MCVGSAVYQTIGQFALLRLQTGFKAFPSLSHYVLLYHKAYNFILLYCTNCIWLQLFSDHVTKVRNPIWRFFVFVFVISEPICVRLADDVRLNRKWIVTRLCRIVSKHAKFIGLPLQILPYGNIRK